MGLMYEILSIYYNSYSLCMYEFLKRRSCTEVLPLRFSATCSTTTQHIFIVASVYTKQTVTTPTCVIVEIKSTHKTSIR
jgi:hypothetical protein